MKAVVRREYGDTSVLHVDEVDEPVPAPNQVIVDVRAAGVNMAEWHLMTGEPTLMRLGTGLRRPRQPVLGQDVAGVVAAIGPGITRFAVGDEVFGSARGSWATRASAKEELLQPLPPGVSFEQAAAVPMAGYTALQALRAVGDLHGAHVAVTGAGGGVGSYAVQLAAARGAHVTAVCSAAKAGFVRELGAHEVIDYATTNPTEGSRRFDTCSTLRGACRSHSGGGSSRPVARWCSGAARTAGRFLAPCPGHSGLRSSATSRLSRSWHPRAVTTSPNSPQRSHRENCTRRSPARTPSPMPPGRSTHSAQRFTRARSC